MNVQEQSNPDQHVSLDETLQTWNSMAQQYFDHFTEMTRYNTSYDTFLQILSPILHEDEATVLDVGCGPGIIGKYLLENSQKHFPNTLKLTGIDAAPNMITLAQQHFPTVRWEVLDGRRMRPALSDESFYGIVVGFCIPYLNQEEVPKFFADVYSLLKSQGILYLSFVPGDPSLSDFKTNNKGQRVYFQYHTEDQIKTWLRDSHLEVVERIVVLFPRQEKTEEHVIYIARKE
eukprot:gene15542-17414_t